MLFDFILRGARAGTKDEYRGHKANQGRRPEESHQTTPSNPKRRITLTTILSFDTWIGLKYAWLPLFYVLTHVLPVLLVCVSRWSYPQVRSAEMAESCGRMPIRDFVCEGERISSSPPSRTRTK
jgi:hypothetical protein